MADGSHIEPFQRARPQLKGLAYRMLGSFSDAEDIVQDAWIRWQSVDQGKIECPDAFLRKVVTRLCLDELKSAKRRREEYVGPWLPEPATDDRLAHEGMGHLAEDITIAFLLALEKLSPAERAVLLLHDVFATPFQEISGILGRSEAACRQTAVRARKRLRSDRIHLTADRDHAQRMADAFIAAVRAGDMAAIEQVLSDDVKVHTDGGGIRPAAINVIKGKGKAVRLFLGLRRQFGGSYPHIVSKGMFNGSPGFVSRDADGEPQITILEPGSGGRIAAIYVVRNPEKLASLQEMPSGDQSARCAI